MTQDVHLPTLPINISIEVNHDLLAELIAQKLRTANPNPGEPATTDEPLIEVQELRRQLGRRGRPMATTTFERRFIATGLLQYLEGPNRAKRYVDRATWQHITAEIAAAKTRRRNTQ